MTKTLEHANGVTVQVFPCRCGETHRGEYAAEDYAHHNCFHGPLMVRLDNQAICVLCGAVFELTAKPSAEYDSVE